jgi:chromate reductase, NAD(P)H dehydrogenase (quinone)
MRIVGLPGSLRQDSVNRRLLDAAATAASDEMTLEVFDGIGELPHFNEDEETQPPHPAVADLVEAIEQADAVLIATPEYNASIPGVLKNALDWASRPHGAAPLADMPVAVVGASPSRFGAVRAQADVRKVATSIGAHVLDRDLPVAQAFDAFAEDGRLVDADLQAALNALLDELVELTTSSDAQSVA